MRRFLVALTLLVAARGALAQGMKIGYVDVQRAVQEVEEGKAARGRLQAELQQEQLQKAFIDAQTAAGQMQEELSGKEQEAMQSISMRLLPVVAEISDRENFTFVLDKAALLYAPAASDLTNEVVRRYNERFGKGETKAAKTATPAKPPPANPPPKK